MTESTTPGVLHLSGVTSSATGAPCEEVFQVGGHRVELSAVKGGAFLMGATDDDDEADDKERPRHEVHLSGYRIARTQVTQGLYEAVMGANPSNNPASPQHPVENVSWFDALRFCNALSQACGLEEAYTLGEGDSPDVSCDFKATGFRLPTEAEWECAAAAGQHLKFSGAQSPDEVSWHVGNSGGSTNPVALKTPNAWGVYDMSGNVFEWCWDWFEAYAPRALEAGQRGSHVTNPTGAQAGTRRVLRGGVFVSAPRGLRVTYRDTFKPDRRLKFAGFRVAASLPT